MPERMTFETLKAAVSRGDIDTVITCFPDMQGRLLGKRQHARYFIESGHDQGGCCNYLLVTDLAMRTVESFRAATWAQGYGDYALRPDLDTLRPMPWLEKTAMVLCDVLDPKTMEPVAHAPRQMLKTQLAWLSDMGLSACMATELEFFLFRKGYETLRDEGYRDLQPHSGYNADYHVFQSSKEEFLLRPLRNHLYAAGIPVECTKGEAEAGQIELNLRYGFGLEAADHHTISKHAVKEMAWAAGHAASFLAKWRADRVGSASHVHVSLMNRDGGSAFHDPHAEFGMSPLMRQFCAGLIAHAPEMTVFFAPYVNSYKRFARGTFAPTKLVWSVDNRGAAFRLVGANSKSVRMECRMGGADLNPYLAMSAMLAAGMSGIERGLDLAPPVKGDAHDATGDDVPDIPHTLRDAIEALRGSKMLRKALGHDVVDHYVEIASWEQEAFDRAITDWEIARGFELC